MPRSLSGDLWEDLFTTYMIIALVVGGLVLGWLFYNMWKFRHTPGKPAPADAPKPGVIPAERGHVLWVYLMAGGIAAIMFSLAFSTLSAVETIEHPPEGEPWIQHDVTGFQFGWRMNYTGDGNVPFAKSSPADAFVVPLNGNVVINITSDNVWHNFALPDYRIRIDVIPGEVTHIWFKPTELGKTHAVCVMICGTGHAQMRVDIDVVDPAAYDAWMHAESAKAYARLLARPATVVANGTWDGANFALEAKSNPTMLNITNTLDRQVVLQEPTLGRLTVPANGYAYWYVGGKNFAPQVTEVS